MYAYYVGPIAEDCLNHWCDFCKDDVFDVVSEYKEFSPATYGFQAPEYFGRAIRVDWGGSAYRVTKEQLMRYEAEHPLQECAKGVSSFAELPDGREYAVLNVELY